jgi:hypothetical protein
LRTMGLRMRAKGVSVGESGVISFADGREAVACAIAGALAEAGLTRLDVQDPRTCRGYVLMARESDVPKTLLEAAAGTTVSGDGVALLVDEREIRWVADEGIATALRSLTAR